MEEQPINPREIRTQAMEQMPYLARAFMALTPTAVSQEMPKPMLVDDQWNLYYNPEQIAESVKETTRTNVCLQLTFTMCAEVVRLLQCHADRCRKFIPDQSSGQKYVQSLAEIASTAIANTICHQSGVSHSSDTLVIGNLPVTQRIVGVPAIEDVLRELLEKFPPPPEMPGPQNESDNQSGQQGDSGTGEGGGNGGGGEPEGEGERKEQDHEGEGHPEQNPQGKGAAPQYREYSMPKWDELQDCRARSNNLPSRLRNASVSGGSAVDGIPRSWESQRQDQPEYQYANRALGDQARQATARAISGGGRGCGKASAELRFWAEQQDGHVEVQPRDLQTVLKQYSDTCMGQHIRRYNGRNRRQQQLSEYNHCKFVLPTESSPKLDIVFVLDTSGSMDRGDLRIAVSYIASLLEKLAVAATARMYIGDEHPRLALKVVNPATVRRLNLEGEGGTDMQSCCEVAIQDDRAHGNAPNLCVCVTDGMTSWEENPISLPTLVVLVPEDKYTVQDYPRFLHQNDCPPPPWADVSVIDVKQVRTAVNV